MNELKSFELKQTVSDIISNSGLPVSLAYYVMKDITDSLLKSYTNAVIQQQKQLESESEVNEQDDN